MSEAAYVRRPRRRVATAAPPAGRFLTVIAASLTAGLLLYILMITVVLPQLRIKRVHVQADFEIDQEYLLQLAGLSGTQYFFNLRPGVVAARLEEYPPIRSAEVERIFPNALRLNLQRRRAVALTMFRRESGYALAAVDQEGVIFESGSHLGGSDLPVISGVQFEGVPVGSRMPDMLHRFLVDLYRLQVEEPRLFDRISELQVVPRRSGGFDIVLYTADYRIPVRLGDSINAEVCRWALMVLDVVSKQEGADRIAEVDFRSGEIVYRMKEDTHGQ